MGMLWGNTASRRGRRVAVELKCAEVDRVVSRYREVKVNKSDGGEIFQHFQLIFGYLENIICKRETSILSIMRESLVALHLSTIN